MAVTAEAKNKLFGALPDVSLLDLEAITALLRLLLAKQFPAFWDQHESTRAYRVAESLAIELNYDPDFYKEEQDYASRSAREIVPLLVNWVQPRSVVDLGCGVGAWLSMFTEMGIDDVLGIDGDWVKPSCLCIPESKFQSRDLKQPICFERRFDLAISLEVGEHLPSESGEILVESLCRLAPVICFSAAIPFQGGRGHINEQWPEYWTAKFSKHGFECVDCIRPHIWTNNEVEPFYAQNMFLFCSSEGLEKNPRLNQEREIQVRAEFPRSLVHPKVFIALIYNSLLVGSGCDRAVGY